MQNRIFKSQFEIVDANKKEVFKTETMNYLLANKSASYDLNNIRISNLKLLCSIVY